LYIDDFTIAITPKTEKVETDEKLPEAGAPAATGEKKKKKKKEDVVDLDD